jgi:hypothetical protein
MTLRAPRRIGGGTGGGLVVLAITPVAKSSWY